MEMAIQNPGWRMKKREQGPDKSMENTGSWARKGVHTFY
jgi:hypothetical protein